MKTLLTLALLLGAGSWAGAMPDEDGPGGGGPPRMENRFKKVAKELGLSEKQIKELKDHKKDSMRQARRLKLELAEKRDDLRDLLEEEKLDEAKVRKLHSQMKEVQNKLADLRLDGILKVRQILTAEQFEKFEGMMRARMGPGQGRGRFGGFGRGGPGPRGGGFGGGPQGGGGPEPADGPEDDD